MLIVSLLIIIVLLVPLINTFIQSKKEYEGEYDFRVSKIVVTPTKQLEFYTMEDKKIALWNYTIMEDEGVEVGDSIRKAKCSFYLYVLKKDSSGEYRDYMRMKPSGLFPYSMFCKEIVR